MAKFTKVVEAVVCNMGGEIDRVRLLPDFDDPELFTLPVDIGCHWPLHPEGHRATRGSGSFRVGDTITIEEREEEIE